MPGITDGNLCHIGDDAGHRISDERVLLVSTSRHDEDRHRQTVELGPEGWLCTLTVADHGSGKTVRRVLASDRSVSVAVFIR